MDPEVAQFLNLRNPPALYAEMHVRWTLNINAHEFDALVTCGLLRPLGSSPPVNSPKWFAGCEIRRLAHDVEWLNKARTAIVKHWKRRNKRAKANRNGENGKALFAIHA